MDKKTSGGNAVTNVQKVEPEFGKDIFIRDVLVTLAKTAKTPTDILTCEFSEVTLTKNEYLNINADVQINYTCTVGIDRTEEYYDSNAKMNKTRTVTDWSPLSGTNNSRESVWVKNGEDYNCLDNNNRIQYAYEVCDEQNVTDSNEVPVKVLPIALQNAQVVCGAKCFSKVSLPGDRHQDESHSTKMDIKEIKCAIFARI